MCIRDRAGLDGAEQLLQFGHFAGEVVFGFGAVAAQCAHGDAVGAGGTAEAQVDTAGVELAEGAKGFGDHQRSAVSYTPLRAHETVLELVRRLLLEKKKKNQQ